MDEPSYPPHHPLHGVALSEDEIKEIIALTVPSHHLLSIDVLPAGRSFNNRIYFVKFARRSSSEANDATVSHDELVLKVNGHFFGRDKTQGEVCSLWLLENYCPTVPSPRVVAWSEDGDNVVSTSGDTLSHHSVAPDTGNEKSSRPGWILMTRVAGEPVVPAELGKEDSLSIADQLAQVIASWRLGIPKQAHCGSICFQNLRVTPVTSLKELILGTGSHANHPELKIRGLVGEGIPLSDPIVSMLQYQQTILSQKLKERRSRDTYKNSQGAAELVDNFVSDTLPQLPIFSDLPPNDFLFTHYDLSPRNVLVSGTPPRITGIVDFEFAGFFPATEEFVNDNGGNEGDWSPEFYEAYERGLEKRGVATPLKSMKKEAWDQALWLGSLAGNTAPWWLPGGKTGEELEDEIGEADGKVKEYIARLVKLASW